MKSFKNVGMSRPRLIALLLALITLAVYLPVGGHSFVDYDDNDYVTNNYMVQAGLTAAGVKWALTSGLGANWFPVTWLSHMMDCELFKLNAGAHHLVNVLFHAANAVLLFMLLLRLTGLRAEAPARQVEKIWPAAFAAMLFAWHPLHVESVAWVAERKDMLSTFFGLLAMLSYARYAQQSSRRYYGLALFWFALSLMSKPMLVTLPFLLLLLDYWPLQRFSLSKVRWPVLREKIPFCLLAAASCLITLKMQHAAMPAMPFPLSLRLENAAYAAGHYLSQTLWPDSLSVFYPFKTIPIPAVALAVAVLLAISFAVWCARERNRCWLVGWLWFLGTLVPVIGLVQVGSAAMADRYLYLPSIGIFIAVSFGFFDLIEKWPRTKNYFAGAAALVLVACVTLTERQLSYWKNTETLFRHVLAATGDSDIARDNLGVALERQGRYEEALAEYCQAVTLNPYECKYHFFVGNMLERLGRPAAAWNEYQQCLAQKPTNALFHAAAGNALAAQSKFPDALAAFARAEQLDAQLALPHIGVANVLLKLGDRTNAVANLWAAVRAEPYNYETLSIVARILATYPDEAVRDGPNAVIIASKANEFSNGLQLEALDALGMALAEVGDFTNAVRYAQRALELAQAAQMKNIEPLQNRLELYQHQQPWRESFRAIVAPAQTK